MDLHDRPTRYRPSAQAGVGRDFGVSRWPNTVILSIILPRNGIAAIGTEGAVPGEEISTLNKGLGSFAQPLESGDVRRLGWNLLREDVSLPAAVLYEDKLKNNLDWMSRFIGAYQRSWPRTAKRRWPRRSSPGNCKRAL